MIFGQTTSKAYPTVLGLVLSALVVAVIPVNSIGFELPKLLLASVLALLFLPSIFAFRQGSYRFASAPFVWVFMVGIVLSVALSVAPWVSVAGAPPRFEGALVWSVFLLIYVGAAHVATDRRGRAVLLRCILWSSVPIILHGTAQWLGMDPLAGIFDSDLFLGRVFSFAGHPNTLAQFLLLVVPMISLHAWKRESKAAMALLLLGLGVLAATASRSGLLGLAVQMLLAIPVCVRVFSRGTAREKRTLVVLFALAVSILAIVTMSAFSERFSHGYEEGRSISSRSLIWRTAVSMLAEHPLGYGPETMGLVSPRFLGPELYTYESLTATVDRAHNLVLDLLLAIGPVGTVGFFGILLASVLALMRNKERAESSPEAHAAAFSIAGFLVASFFGFPTALSWTFFWLIAGMLAGATATQTSSDRRRGLRALAVVLGVSALLGTALVGGTVLARMKMDHGQRLLATDAEAGADFLLQATALAPFDREVITLATETHLRLASVLVPGDPAREATLLRVQALLAHLQRVTHGTDGIAYALAAWLAGLRGDGQDLHAQLFVAKAQMPSSVIVRRVGAQAYRSLGDEDAARREEHSIRELLPQAFFREGSETRRIILKENPWLPEVIPDIAN